jgi:hypothetical protein
MRRQREFGDVIPYWSAILGRLCGLARLELQRSPDLLRALGRLLLPLTLRGAAVCLLLFSGELLLLLSGPLLLPPAPLISRAPRLVGPLFMQRRLAQQTARDDQVGACVIASDVADRVRLAAGHASFSLIDEEPASLLGAAASSQLLRILVGLPKGLGTSEH